MLQLLSYWIHDIMIIINTKINLSKWYWLKLGTNNYGNDPVNSESGSESDSWHMPCRALYILFFGF